MTRFWEVLHHHILTYGAEPFLRSCQLCSYSRTSKHFRELEGSLSCSQEPSIGPYPKPDRSSPHHPIPLSSILILSTHLHLGLPSGLFPSGFPINVPYIFLFSPHSCYMPCPSHPPWLDHCHFVWRKVQVMKLLIMQFSLFTITYCFYLLMRHG
jgi:hypothetical protein